MIRGLCQCPRAEGLAAPIRQALLHLQLLIISGDMVNPVISDRGCRVILSDLATVVLFSKVLWRVARDAAAVSPELQPLTADPEELLRCGNMICLFYPKHLCPALAHQGDTVRG